MTRTYRIIRALEKACTRDGYNFNDLTDIFENHIGVFEESICKGSFYINIKGSKIVVTKTSHVDISLTPLFKNSVTSEKSFAAWSAFMYPELISFYQFGIA